MHSGARGDGWRRCTCAAGAPSDALHEPPCRFITGTSATPLQRRSACSPDKGYSRELAATAAGAAAAPAPPSKELP